MEVPSISMDFMFGESFLVICGVVLQADVVAAIKAMKFRRDVRTVMIGFVMPNV